MSARRLWIFRVSGGASFDIQVKGNPTMRHDGRPESILRTLCSDDQAMRLKEEMQSYGCSVTAHCPMESAEQAAERRNVLQVIGGERPFPSPRCPECAWFDPHIESLCGAGLAYGKPGWDDETIRGSMSSDKFREDFESCPLREGQIQ
jgi:hypothetical protein